MCWDAAGVGHRQRSGAEFKETSGMHADLFRGRGAARTVALVGARFPVLVLAARDAASLGPIRGRHEPQGAVVHVTSARARGKAPAFRRDRHPLTDALALISVLWLRRGWFRSRGLNPDARRTSEGDGDTMLRRRRSAERGFSTASTGTTGSLVIEAGQSKGLRRREASPPRRDRRRRWALLLVPGFIDLQVNGGGGRF